jgi:uncharacterized membrane protein
MELFGATMEVLGAAANIAGASIIVIGALNATARFLLRKRRRENPPPGKLRRELGQAFLLGVEFLIAADIVRASLMPPESNSLFLFSITALIQTVFSTVGAHL